MLIGLAAPAASHAENPANAPIIVANDRADDMRALLGQGWNPNTRIKGQPAIMQAVRDGAWRVYDVLAADRRTDVNAANDHDETPLMYLAIQGQTDRAKALIARGAQVNRLGWTPLHYAASKGQMEMAKLLLAHKAIVNAPGPDGTTPLMMAGLSGSREMTDLLLKADADPTMRNTQGLDAAAWADSAHHQDLAAELRQASSARMAALRGAGGGASAGTPTSTVPAAPAAPAAAPTPTGALPPPPQPGAVDPTPPTLKGVEGVRLDPDASTRK
nr:ankyrin repeat domain-containing protein [Bordetella genomosp. 9]